MYPDAIHRPFSHVHTMQTGMSWQLLLQLMLVGMAVNHNNDYEGRCSDE